MTFCNDYNPLFPSCIQVFSPILSGNGSDFLQSWATHPADSFKRESRGWSDRWGEGGMCWLRDREAPSLDPVALRPPARPAQRSSLLSPGWLGGSGARSCSGASSAQVPKLSDGAGLQLGTKAAARDPGWQKGEEMLLLGKGPHFTVTAHNSGDEFISRST